MAIDRADERADMAGHPPTMSPEAERLLLAEVRDRYPQWEITGTSGAYKAKHRTEQPDERRERARIVTEVEADTVQQLEIRLYVQRALRGDAALEQAEGER
ncbi:hypothetical protein LG943_10780 [Streptomonospora sp. S1-112]|uniref:Uncharacterized protein n=1 Tax=Streptomonospora mangrovi TaxID=2883123 RepID=A0A9X3NN29_9ACTN|nr:hypothetical protein [Streptomonospora mangrovi]MDA0564804.1 hypothetical protein [Streptomonospora mangrovi]